MEIDAKLAAMNVAELTDLINRAQARRAEQRERLRAEIKERTDLLRSARKKSDPAPQDPEA